MTGPYPWPVLNIIGPLCALTLRSTLHNAFLVLKPRVQQQQLEHPLPAGPFDVVSIDLLQLPRSIQGSIYVLVCVDHFSRFTVLAPLPNKSATTMAHAIVSHLICPYTTPRVLLIEYGIEFKSQVLR